MLLLSSRPRSLTILAMFTLESPDVSHIGVRETGGQDVGAVLVPLPVAATWGEGLASDKY